MICQIKEWCIEKRWRSAGLLVLRAAFGAGMVYHGYGKVFGGIENFAGFVGSLGFPMPVVFAWAAALSEFAGGILLILGLATRPAALMVICTMGVAAFGAHGADPFKKKELALAYLFAGLAIFLCGAGKYALDSLFSKKRND